MRQIGVLVGPDAPPQLCGLDHKTAAAEAEDRRLVELYQAGLIALVELQRRAKELDTRRTTLDDQGQHDHRTGPQCRARP